jgi:hypothetical protein
VSSTGRDHRPPPSGRPAPVPALAADDRVTNVSLGVLLLVIVGSGLAANTFGTPLIGRWVVILHGVASIGLLVLSRRKGRIMRRSLARPRRRPGTPGSVALAALSVITLVSGLIHGAGLTDRVGPLTLMQVHIGAAVLLVPLALSHYRRRPQRRRPHPAPIHRPPADESGALNPTRRGVVQGAAVTATAGLLWVGWEGGLRFGDAPGADRRFTGSHERGSGDADALPVTQWLDDRVQVIDPHAWRLGVAGRRLSLADLHAMPQDDIVATLDCTSLWWSEQVWRGVRLDRLIEPGGARSVVVRSANGYRRLFPIEDLATIWLALECGGQRLSAGHGHPARIVAPDRRGFWWVKWVVSIERSDTPWWLQPPYPLT